MKTRYTSIAAAAAISCALLSSCNIYKKFDVSKQSDSDLVEAYAKACEEQEDENAFGNLDWRTVFTDPVLQNLITQALDNNVDLQNALLNVDIARAQLKGAKLAYFPSLALAPNAATGKYFDVSDWSKTYQLPATVSWEVDVFAKLLNTKRGAQASVLRSEAYAQAARSQIIAAVANCYYTLATLESQLELSRQTAQSWSESVQVMKDMKLAGRVTEAAVVQSTAQYHSILAQITDLEASLVQTNNSMSLLLAVMPQHWNVSPNAMLSLPQAMEQGVPMRELASRPDVIAAEQGLAAAYYTTASARSSFYPSLAITANGGFTNLIGSVVMNPGKFFINLAGQLTIPIFSRGAKLAQLESAKAQQKQAINTFEYTLMSAAADVSNALTVYEKNTEKQALLAIQTDNLQKAVDYTQDLLYYGTNNTTYLEVLTAQQSLLSSQMAEISCRQSRSQAVINLYQSLGGGRK